MCSPSLRPITRKVDRMVNRTELHMYMDNNDKLQLRRYVHSSYTYLEHEEHNGGYDEQHSVLQEQEEDLDIRILDVLMIN